VYTVADLTGMVIDANTGLITWNNPTLGNTKIAIGCIILTLSYGLEYIGCDAFIDEFYQSHPWLLQLLQPDGGIGVVFFLTSFFG
jgi:hypothetical protein